MRLCYRQAGSEKFLNLCLATVILGFGLAGCTLSLTEFASRQGLIIATVVTTAGAYYLVTIFRSQLLIDEDRIEVRTAFRKQTANLSDIEGFRTIVGRGGADTLLQVRGGGKNIIVPHAIFDIDDRFRSWLRRFPDLDRR